MSLESQADELRAAGYSSDEIKVWQDKKAGELLNAGFSQEEVSKSLGLNTPDMEPFRKQVQENIKQAATGTDGTQKPLDFIQALQAGAQMSTLGLAVRGKMPSLTPTGGESQAARIGMMSTQIIGDIPAMTAGFIAGGAAGVETGPGAVITGTAGAFALPAGIRATLIDGYTKGDFKNFWDFWDRAKGIITEEAKGWVTGAATGAAGVAAGAALPAAAPKFIQSVIPETAEIAAMSTVGPALNGEVPKWQDFEDAGIVMFGLKAARLGSSKFMELYKNTGVKPVQAIADTKENPTIIQDVAAEVPVPKAYQYLEESKAPKIEIPKPEAKPEDLTAQDRILSKINQGGSNELPKLSWDKLYTAFVDDLHPINQITKAMAEGKPLAAEDSPYVLARLTRGSSGRAQSFLENGPFDFNTYETTGPSLKDIQGPAFSLRLPREWEAHLSVFQPRRNTGQYQTGPKVLDQLGLGKT